MEIKLHTNEKNAPPIFSSTQMKKMSLLPPRLFGPTRLLGTLEYIGFNEAYLISRLHLNYLSCQAIRQ